MAYAWGFGGGGTSNNGASYTYPGPVGQGIGGQTGNVNLAGSTVTNYKSVTVNGSYSNCYPSYDGNTVYLNRSGGGSMYFSRYIDNGYDLYDYGDGTYWTNGGLQGTVYWSTVPTMPQALTITSNASLTISGSYTGSASDGGETISSYSMQYRTSSDGSSWGSWTGTKTVSGGAWSFSSLTPATYYQFRIYANNSEGSSAARTTSTAYVPAGGKVWNGSAWVARTRKMWTGSAWKIVIRKRWNGSSWSQMN